MLIRYGTALCIALAASSAIAGPSPVASPGTSPASFGSAELDAAVESRAKEKGLAVSGLCDDATFLRRASLDLTGVIPAPAEVTAFLADASADKRGKKIEELLARPEFDQHWSAQLRGFMMGKAEAKAVQVFARKGVEDWLEEKLRANEGYDKIVSQMLTAEGAFIDNPAVGFLMRKDVTPEDLAARTGKVFLGAQIQCAQCHDHPFEKWSQKDFYGMVGFFARTRTVPVPEPALELVRAGVPLPMIRRLVLDPNGDKGGKKPGKPGRDRAALAAAFDGAPMQRLARRLGFGAGRGAPANDGGTGPGEPSMTGGATMGASGEMMEGGTGPGGPGGPGGRFLPPGVKVSYEEVLAMAARARAQIQEEMPNEGLPPGESVPGLGANEPGANLRAAIAERLGLARPAGKGKKQMRRVPVVFELPRGEAVIPDPTAPAPDNKFKQAAGEQVAPRFLDGTTPDGSAKRRVELARWLTAPENPYFAKAAANRFFAMLTGTPLVSPVDNVIAPNEKALAPVLEQIAAQFARSGFDLRALCRLVVGSRTYQRDLVAKPGAEKDRTFLTHASARQLTPEQLFASFLKATGVEEAAKLRANPRFEQLKEGFLRQFVFTFETDEGAEVELFHETIPQALMMLNSRQINGPVQAAPGGVLMTIAANNADTRQRVDQLYLATLSRHATGPELEKLGGHVDASVNTVNPEQPGMDEPEPLRPRDLFEGMGGRGAGRRFGMGLGRGGGRWKVLQERFGGKGAPARGGPDAAGGGTDVTPSSTPPRGPSPAALARNPFRSPGERQAYEDILWSLVSCSEFLYNH